MAKPSHLSEPPLRVRPDASLPMRHRNSILQTVVGCAAVLLLAGCFAPPKRHAWQITREDAAQVQGADSWPQLSTNDYIRVPDPKRQDAVTLLQEHSFVKLDPLQLSTFAPSLADSTSQAFLVRGVAFSLHPAYTIVRWNAVTRYLLVQQFTYNGEMLMPFRWVAEPNALVVLLPHTPEYIYPDAVLGGDLIFRGRDWKTLDRR